LKRGKIKKEPCNKCGSKNNLQMHHEDYSKPLEIIWLCLKCHREKHAEDMISNPYKYDLKIPKSIPKMKPDPSKLCGKCNKPNDRFPNRYCTECHSKYMREWRKTHIMTPEQKKKDSCRSYAGSYLKRGKIKRKPCEECGAKKVMIHHKDYDKPLEITWLCQRHHRIVTAELRKERKKEKILFTTGGVKPPNL